MRRSQAPANDDGGTGVESASVPNQLDRPDKQRTNKGWPRASACFCVLLRASGPVLPLTRGGPVLRCASPCCGSTRKLPGQSKQRVAPASQTGYFASGTNEGWPLRPLAREGSEYSKTDHHEHWMARTLCDGPDVVLGLVVALLCWSGVGIGCCGWSDSAGFAVVFGPH